MSAWPDQSDLAAAAERHARIRERIAAACRRAGRDPGEVRIVGACKRQPLSRIAAAVAAGVDELGHNYVQEARDVRPAVEALLAERGLPAPRWRMIGHLQRNKARQAVQLFDAVDTLDRASLAIELDKRAAATGVRLEVSLQVHLSDEPTKSGVTPDEAPALLEACASLEHLRATGLMTMPAADPDAARQAFRQLRDLRDTLRAAPGGGSLESLDMGMSGDFETAVEEGATRVRIGTALFGERAPR